MVKPLRLLIVEDSEPDAILLAREVRLGGYDVAYKQVKTAKAFDDAIESEPWDIVISDYFLPGYSGLKALRSLQEKQVDIPFLMISGIINEEMAVEVLCAGADDFFLKDKLARLVPAIERELRESRARQQRQQIEERLNNSEERFIKSFHANPLAIMICRIEDTRFVDVNKRFLRLLNCTRNDVIGKTLEEFQLCADQPSHTRLMMLMQPDETSQDVEIQMCTHEGAIKDVLISSEPIQLHGEPCVLAMIVDITERKQIERAELEQRMLAEALRETALALNSTLELSQVLDSILDNLENVIEFDAANIMMIEGDQVQIVRTQGYEHHLPRTVHAISELSVLQSVVASKQPILISDTRNYPEWNDVFPDLQIFSYIAVPILLREEVIGFLNLYSFQPGFFAKNHLYRLEAFGSQAALALQNARLYQQAQALAAMEERQRLSHDLHDAVSQMLFISSILADSIPRLMEKDTSQGWAQLDQIKRLNRGALAEMRKLLLELRSESIAEVSVHELMGHLAQAVMGHTQVDVTLDIALDTPLRSELKVALYRIAQEALNNVVKHASANLIQIVLNAHQDQGTLIIKDDGKGFDVEQINAGHLGLGIMQERARAVGADCQIISRIGTGTEILVTWGVDFPLQ